MKFLTWSGLLEVSTLLACVASAIGFLAKVWWIFELACHFRLHLMLVLGLFSAIWLLLKRRRLATVCGTFALVNALVVFPLLIPAQDGGSPVGGKLRLVSLNVHTANQHADLVVKFLRESDADVIFLMEVNDRWMADLSSLKDVYPVAVGAPREDNFGIALFSRLPLEETNVIEIGEADVPSVTAKIKRDGLEVFLIGTHPLPPGSTECARLRNDQLSKIKELVRKQTLPTVVLGDLNLTPWSPYFSNLLKGTGLKNSSQGLGLFNSWPAALGGLGIPIDHCLVSPGFAVTNKKLGPHVGSDHLPVIIELQLTGIK
jgi:endonuclease/exonuclease/phosphatase (EEP) superfamily protein YafD